MHFNADDASAQMTMDLISSANDFSVVSGTCDCLGKISEIDLESRRNTGSVVLTPEVSGNVTQLRPRPNAAENVSSCAPTVEGHLLARALPLKRSTEGKPPASTEPSNKKDSCRKSEPKDRRSTLSTV